MAVSRLRIVAWIALFIGIVCNNYLTAQVKKVQSMQRSPGAGLTELPYRGSPQGSPNVFHILERSSETGGRYFTVSETSTPKSAGFDPTRPGSPPPHVHTFQKETFVVKSGVFLYEAAGKLGRAEAGETVVVPAGVVHTWWPSSEADSTTVEVTLEPAGRHGEGVFETMTGLCRDYGSMEQIPKLQMVLWAVENGMVMSFIPPPVWWLLEKVGVPIARKMGYKSYYDIYSTRSASAATSGGQDEPYLASMDA